MRSGSSSASAAKVLHRSLFTRVGKEEEVSRNDLNTNQGRSVVEITVSGHLRAGAKFPQTLEVSSRAPESSKLCGSAPMLQDKRGIVCECSYTAREMLSPPDPLPQGKGMSCYKGAAGWSFGQLLPTPTPQALAPGMQSKDRPYRMCCCWL